MVVLKALPAFVVVLGALTACRGDGPAERAPATQPAPTEREDSDAAAERLRLENLASLGYVQTIPVSGPEAEREGVVHHARALAQPGWNLFAPRDRYQVLLVDMGGDVVKEWVVPLPGDEGFNHVEPLPGGELLAIVKDRALLRLASDGNVAWQRRGRFHHDVAPLHDGRILAVSRVERLVDVAGERVPILDDLLLFLTADGEVDAQHSVWDLFGDRVPRERLRRIRARALELGLVDLLADPDRRGEVHVESNTLTDVFHVNAVEPLTTDVAGLGREGDVLVSVRELDTVAVVDLRSGVVGWSWGPGVVEKQHDPHVLADGHVLLFDNGPERGWSRLVEVDPVSGTIAWEYRDSPPERFFSRTRGACQRLPNGNTLVTESDKGRVFEVTASGVLAWEFLAPVRQAAEGGAARRERAAIYRMVRLPASQTVR